MHDIKLDEILHGFRVKAVFDNDEFRCYEYHMEHEKSGAKLIFMDRDDRNMTFVTGFRTLAYDDSGVFHVIEHAVLDGSEKYPVKEPYVELLKSSLQTYLNAATYPDKTLYPLSSQNEKDFLNLASVYLDGIFCPLFKKDPAIFFSEAAHLDFNDAGELEYNGIVYSEMKGSYSSPHRLLWQGLSTVTFGEGSIYSYDSGGVPEEVARLDYSAFLGAYDKFYHPDNAYFFLDGNVPLDEILTLIDGYISHYDRRNFDTVPTVIAEKGERRLEIDYEVGEGNEDNIIMGISFLGSRDSIESSAIEKALVVLAVGDYAPLRERILSSGLAEKMSVSIDNDKIYDLIAVSFEGVKKGHEDELRELFYTTLRELVDAGIDRDALEAYIDTCEFSMREKNNSGPMGIMIAEDIYSSWMWDCEPTAMLTISKLFPPLREKLSGEYYEGLLRRYILDNDRCATVIMYPSKSLGEKRSADERKSLNARLASLTVGDVSEIRRISELVLTYQERENTAEELASLPSLSLTDINSEIYRVPTEVTECCGIPIYRHDLDWSGIIYTDFHFDASDISPSDIPYLRLLAYMINESGTDELGGYEFVKFKDRHFGDFGVSALCTECAGEPKLLLTLSVSSLAEKRDKIFEAVPKLLYETTLDDKEKLGLRISGTVSSLLHGFARSGSSYAEIRAGAQLTPYLAAKDMFGGYGYYLALDEISRSFDERADEYISKIKELRERLFVRERMHISVIGKYDPEYETRVTKMIRSGTPSAGKLAIAPLGVTDENYEIPSRIGFAATVGYAGEDFYSDGVATVAMGILEYEYLWQELRVEGGAYGASAHMSGRRTTIFTSYRDPSPERSLAVFRAAPEFLRDFVRNTPDLTSYIIGTVGSMESCAADPDRARREDLRLLTGESYETVAGAKRDILATTHAELLAFADFLEEALASAVDTVFAPRELLPEGGKTVKI